MRSTIVITMLAAVFLTVSATPWPVGVTPGGQDSSWTIMTSYGTFHFDWEDVANPDSSGNFHFGIDIPDYPGFVGEDTVRCVRDGYVTDRIAVPIPTKADSQYVLVICDSMSSPDGWCYQHMDTPNFSETDAVFLSDSLAVMDPLVEPQAHLHFMRSLFEYDHRDPGLLNPLDSLMPPASAASGFSWEFAQSADTLFFLEEMDHLAWPQLNPGHQEDVWQYQIQPDNIHDAVDLFYGYRLLGNGTNPISLGEFPLNPHMIKWTASKYLVSDTSEVLTRYVAEFTGQIGASADSTKYRQFYFRWSRLNYLIPSLGNGLISCLTNCGDSTGWDGIDNIEENCWQTDSDNQFSGTTTNPVLAAFPDGPYRIDVTSYAWDTTETHEVNLDVELHNFSPVVEEVVISCEGRTIWEAYWTADGLTPVLYNPFNAGVLPDQQLDVTVVFSEPMDTTSVTVTAGMTSPYNDVTASDAGLDWSWTNCPEEPEYKDTWHGVFEDLSSFTTGRATVSIQAQDRDGNGLMDPSIPCSDGTDYSDTHHGFSVMGSQPGWPVTLSANCYGSPTIADLDGDGDLEVSLICDDGNVYLLDDNGSSFVPGIWPEIISDWNPYFFHLKSSPALADLDGDAEGKLDLIAFLTPGCGAEVVSNGSNIPGWPVYPGDPEDSLLTGEFPGQTSPVLGNLDDDPYLELLYTRHMASFATIYKHTICMYDHTGIDEVWSRNLQYTTNGASVVSTPAVADFVGDEACEVVVCTAEGFDISNKCSDTDSIRYGLSAVYLLDGSSGATIWKKSFSAWFQASPVIADVDNDGTYEIIVGTDHASGPTDRRKIFVLSGYDGSIEYEEYLGSGVYHSAAVGNINSDNCPDFVVPCNNHKIYAYSGADYSYLPGFPVDIGEIPGAPILINIDMDMDIEIVFGTSSGNLWALNSDGSTCTGFPVAVGGNILGCPAAGEIDGDGHLEIVMVDMDIPAAYCLDLGAGTFPAEMPWRQFQHDSWHTGCFEADNTIPEPPTNLTGEITYTDGCRVDLEWDLSVNDPDHGNPEEPTDVICYIIYRGFPPYPPVPVGRVHAGTETYTDVFNPWTFPVVVYYVTAADGTNESEFSNYRKFPTSPGAVISVGCSVVEEFSGASARIPARAEVVEISESSETERTSLHNRTAETLASAELDVHPSGGNPRCLTDGSVEVSYSPSPGAEAVVIDLGEECSVISVVPDGISEIYPETSSLTDEYDDAAAAAARSVEPSLLIEVAGSDRQFHPFVFESRSTDGVRYVKISGASGLTEISVYGSRESFNEISSLEIARSTEDAGWMFSIPAAAYTEEASVIIYDISGRMVWSGSAETGDVLHWDGYTGNGTAVPNGVYLLQCSVGSEVTTGSFVVRRN